MKKLFMPVALALVIAACGGGGSTGEGFTNPAFGDVTVSGTLVPFENPNSDPAVGQPAPSITGVDPTGAAVEFTPGSSPTVLVFVAHWCSHCQAEVPRIVEWMEANPDRLGVDIYAVATGTAQGQPNYPPADWLEREGWDQPIVMDDADSTVGQSFGLTSYPFWVIVGPDGTVVGRAAGELSIEQIDSVVTAVSEL